MAVVHPEVPWRVVKELERLHWTSYSTPPTPASETLVQDTVFVVPWVTVGSPASVGTPGALSSWVELTKADQADRWSKESRLRTRYQYLLPSPRLPHVISVEVVQPVPMGLVNEPSMEIWCRYSTPPTPLSTTTDHDTVFEVPLVNSGSAVILGTGGALASWVDHTMLDQGVVNLNESHALTR